MKTSQRSFFRRLRVFGRRKHRSYYASSGEIMVPVLRPQLATPSPSAEKVQTLDQDIRAKVLRALLVVVVSGFFCGGLGQQANAQTITGAVQFFGSVQASGPSGPPTTIDFDNNWRVLQGTGTYAGIFLGTPAIFNDFTFVGDGANAMLLGTVTPLWTFDFNGLTYSFDLLSLTNGHTEPGAMSFTGQGVAHITGFDDSFATFSLQGSGNNFAFTLSSSSTAVPEAGTTALLFMGFAFSGALVVRRKLRLRAASAR